MQKRAKRPKFITTTKTTKPFQTSRLPELVAQTARKRALVKSQRKAPTPEWEDASNTLLKLRALVKSKRKAPTPEQEEVKVQRNRGVQKDMI